MLSPSVVTYGLEGWVPNQPLISSFRNPRASPFAPPFGIAPGFDQNHPASKNASVSYIANGANFINLITGRRGSSAGAPTADIDAYGKGVNFQVGTGFSRVTFPTPTGSTAIPILYACIFRLDALTGSQLIMQNIDLSSGASLFASVTSGVGDFGFYFGGGTLQNDSGIRLAAGIPYFIIAETWTGNPMNFAAVNLSTGQAQYAFNVNAGHGPSAGPTGNLFIACHSSTADQSISGTIIAGMYGHGYISPSQMRAWCANPWAFWYPQRVPIVTAAGFFGIIIETLRPDADISISDWTNELGGTTNIFQSIDEAAADDSDYIKSPIPPNGSVARFSVSDPTAGMSLGDPVKIFYRYRKTNAANLELVVTLKQSSTTIASWTHNGAGLTTDFQTATQILTTTQLASITNFNNLFIEFQANKL